MRRKLVATLLGLLTVLFAVFLFGKTAGAAVIPTTGLTANDAVVADRFGNVIQDTSTMNKWQNYTIDYKWSIRDGQPIAAGDTAVVELPNGAAADKDLSFPLKDSEGQVIGTFSIKAGSTTGTITFNDAFANIGTNREGTLNFFAKGTYEDGNHYGWVVNKIGWVSGYDENGRPSQLTWNVAFNPEGLDLGEVVVKDTLGLNQTYVPGSVYAETGSYNSAGTFVATGTVKPTVEVNGSDVTFTFQGISSAVNMTYNAKLTNVGDDQTLWENTATMNGVTVSSQVAWGGSGTGSGENPLGSVTLQKEDADSSDVLAGAQYDLLDADGNVLKSGLTTDQQGQISVSGLTPGSYSFKETKAPQGYLEDAALMPFTIEANSNGSVVKLTQRDKPEQEGQVPLPGEVTLTKSDAATKAVLAGAVYELRDRNDQVVRSGLITNAEGQLVIKDLIAGNYRLVETKAPEGYEINTEPVTFSIKLSTTTPEPVFVTQSDQAVTVAPAQTGSVVLTKTDAETSEVVAGAVYELRDPTGEVLKRDLMTDAQGQLTVTGLEPGYYQLVEVQAPAGYDLATRPVSFVIEAGQTAEAVQVKQKDRPTADVPEAGNFILTKIDAATKQVLAGAVYELRDSAGRVIEARLTTNADGQLVVTNIPAGSYQLIEIEAPDGYQLNPQPIDLKINATDETTINLTATDEAVQVKGAVTLTKTDATKKVVIAGAEYELQDAAGKTIQSGLTTDEQGQLSVENLTAGEYQFVETKAPAGYVLNTEPLKFTIKADQTMTVEVAATDEPEPAKPVEPSTGEVTLTKSNATKETLLAGAEYELQNAEGKVVNSGLTTDAEGKITVSGLVAGEYQFVETKAPAGYELNVTPLKFTITEKQTVTVEVAATDEPQPTQPVEPDTGEVILTKTDAADKKALAGAEYELQDAAGKVLKQNLTTNAEGQLTVSDLVAGEYQFVETKAPAGYELNMTPVKFTITAKQTAAVEVAASDVAEPKQPSEPETPTKPTEPGQPGQPGQPGRPGQPGQPGQPGRPGQSGSVTTPGLPGSPFESAPANGSGNGNGQGTGAGQATGNGLPQTDETQQPWAVVAGLISFFLTISGFAYVDRQRFVG